MFVFDKIIFILTILQAKLQSINGSTHAIIGNYSQLNPKNCGITRFTPNLDYSCFKWHNNIFKGIKGRNSSENEVPWMVFFYNKTSGNSCSGVIIADQWMLTAAHCLESDNPEDLMILPGQHSYIDWNKVFWVNATEVHNHPDYYHFVRIAYNNDLTLLKFDRPINLIITLEGQINNDLNSICLPEANIFNEKQQLALMAGWGRVKRYQFPVQIGYTRVLPSDDYSFWHSHNTLFGQQIDKFLICKGDSGGPLWQFSEGRAVLIGIQSFGFTHFENNLTRCESPNIGSATVYFRISKYIDWIKNVTKLS